MMCGYVHRKHIYIENTQFMHIFYMCSNEQWSYRQDIKMYETQHNAMLGFQVIQNRNGHIKCILLSVCYYLQFNFCSQFTIVNVIHLKLNKTLCQ